MSQKDIAKDQGKPLSKYERNMMIFDWLYTLGKNFILFNSLDKNSFYREDETAIANTEAGLTGQETQAED